MSTTAAAVKARAPEFASLSDEVVETFIADAELQYTAEYFGDSADLAGAYLTAHLLALSYPTLVAAGAGPVQIEKVGELARTYAVNAVSSGAGEYARSRWGLAYWQLLQKNRFPVVA